MTEMILIPGAEIYYDQKFLTPEEATILFDVLRTKCTWQRHRTSFGYAVPLDEAHYANPGTTYTYSRREYKPLTWLPERLAGFTCLRILRGGGLLSGGKNKTAS
jgi:hypothetical protein